MMILLGGRVFYCFSNYITLVTIFVIVTLIAQIHLDKVSYISYNLFAIIAHFRVLNLLFKLRPSAKPFILMQVLFACERRLIFI